MTEAHNLIVIQSDNHNRDVLGAYGHDIVQTPHLDRIASNGVRFDNAYCSSSLCCPSRASLATGLFPHQTGYWDNCLVYDGSRPSWMKRLNAAGHTCVSVGKLHFRSTEDDNGFSREIAPMHIVNGVGGLVMLLRWSESEPAQPGQWQMYAEQSGVGGSDYQDYDREISRLAIDWLQNEAPKQSEPWVLYVSYTSSHPPFSVPSHLFDLYPVESMPLPVAYTPQTRPNHPAYEHLRQTKVIPDLGAEHEAALRRMAAGYFGLITHLDEQIGSVFTAAETLGLLDSTRVVYTSDHGESYGNHGLVGKCQLLETAAAVPLLMAGPGIPQGEVVDELVSHVDLYPTFIESLGEAAHGDDEGLPGESLWPALSGEQRERQVFAEYHASCSKTGSFMLRRGQYKLIYHVDMPTELYDLESDPHEERECLSRGEGAAIARELEAELRDICDPQAVDERCKREQRERVMEFGGNEAVQNQGAFVRTPAPGSDAQMLTVG